MIQLKAAAVSISIVVVVGHGPLENQIECIINTSEKVQGASQSPVIACSLWSVIRNPLSIHDDNPNCRYCGLWPTRKTTARICWKQFQVRRNE